VSKDVETGTEKMLAHVEDGIGWMIVNNPERHNAMGVEMFAAVPQILNAFQDDPDVRVVVVRGAGERAFVSGGDISQFGERRTAPEDRADYNRGSNLSWGAWDALDKPVIAMIRGYCLGGGLLLAMKADIRIASAGSQFGIPAARLGLGYPLSGVEALMALTGPASTAEILFSARRLKADEALQAGLVNRVVADDQLEAEVLALAAAITANAPLTVRACKVAIREARRQPSERDYDRLEKLIEECFLSDDYREGKAAFMEKRTPEFNGR
jgi:enoyl-CoA hydratase/carnithine racemase